MTYLQKQKLVVIATYDGWVKDGYFYTKDTEMEYLVDIPYLTCLNALHAVAMKVLDELSVPSKLNDSTKWLYQIYQSLPECSDEEFRILESIEIIISDIKQACYQKPINGEYIALFEEVYNGVNFLNQQKAQNENQRQGDSKE